MSVVRDFSAPLKNRSLKLFDKIPIIKENNQLKNIHDSRDAS